MIEKRPQGLFHGYYIPFKDNDLSIVFWFSVWSGREKVLCNGNLVAAKWNYSKTSSHTVSVDSNTYTITFETMSFFKGILICTFLKNGKPSKKFKLTTFKVNRKNAKKNLAKLIVAYAGVIGLAVLSGYAFSRHAFPREIILAIWSSLVFWFLYSFFKSPRRCELELEELDAF
jgi:hypothetical protein